jgi:hypothetical protein
MVTFDFQQYYERLSKAKDRLERIKIESEQFRYYDSLSKEDQKEFWEIDRSVRKKEGDKIQAQLNKLVADVSSV